jgi:hypothetical protein
MEKTEISGIFAKTDDKKVQTFTRETQKAKISAEAGTKSESDDNKNGE